MASTILVGSDLADTSDAAVTFALQLGSLMDARVVVVHVVERATLPKGRRAPLARGEFAAFRKVIDWQQASAEQLLARQLRRVGGNRAQAELEVCSGTPAVELLAAARRRRASLVALGMAERPGGPGHVAQRVLATTRTAVVIVPSSARPLSAGRLAKQLRLLPSPFGLRSPGRARKGSRQSR